MADEKHSKVDAYELLKRIRNQSFKNQTPKALFKTESLKETDEEITETLKPKHKSRYSEWDNYKTAVKIRDETVYVHSTASEDLRYKQYLTELEKAYLLRYLIPRDAALQELVLLGQEILRRKYFALLLNNKKTISLSPSASLMIETGAAAIQILGRSPAGPKQRYRNFRLNQAPHTASLGIEILSSGSFPDWTNPELKALREDGAITRMGFENVIDAEADTPRTLALRKLIEEGNDFSPLDFPIFHRMMLDLELMRLGQATTPGTYKMLLNSFFYGALYVDHSTNVSEQVQIIYEEENWKSPCPVNPEIPVKKQAKEAAVLLLTQYFRLKADSIIDKDHPREARIEFDAGVDPKFLKDFFKELMRLLKNGILIGKKTVKIAPVHKITPAVNLTNSTNNAVTVKKMIDLMAEMRFNEFYITSQKVHPEPGLLQYFNSIDETNSVINYSRGKRIRVMDGRTIDIVATSNKAIEAAAGAIESGQGCIKIGLLGLTLEQMKDFIKRVKNGINSSLKRQENQLLVFIGIIDKPMVSENGIFDSPIESANKFVDLMRSLQHDILLIDTMYKGAEDKRLVDAGDKKGGHFTHAQMCRLIKKAQEGRCDLWVAGSYTEEQVYQAAMDPPSERPGLICLGGAERSTGGLRLNPNEAYDPAKPSKEDKKLSAMLEYDADIKYMLSRDNKLARDAGHVAGVLKRKGSAKWRKLNKMRSDYLEKRKAYFDLIENISKDQNLKVKNLDTLTLSGDKVFKNLSRFQLAKIGRLKRAFETERENYVNEIAGQLIILYKDEWCALIK